MEESLDMARSKDTKERMAGVERLYQFLEASRKSLTSSEVTSLVDCCLDLLKDNNYRVSQGALQALASASVLSGEHFKLHFNSLVPAVVERLGDGKQPVRDAARRLLLTLMEVSSPTIIVERAGSYAWMHRSWRVREEFARTVTSAIGLFASTELPLQRVILPPILQMLNDSNHSVREAAVFCIEEMYAHVGPQFREELQRHHLPSSMVKDINARLEKIEPKIHTSNGHAGQFVPGEMKSAGHSQKRSSPKNKNVPRETSLTGVDSDVTEKPVDAVTVYSEKELIREFEKIGATLVPEKDWSVRIAAMQRVEGLLFGGAADYPCFPALLKQLVGPLSIQLSDRRSSVVKQGCHLLCLLSKELLGDFEACAEMLIPVLFKLVVITVLVIAESADNCIKTMLRNCKVSRVLPRIADCAKHDRSAVLRARCCDYALLILEYWADAPEIQRAADLYEDLIKCCVGDAMSEVRATARTCYRMFTKTWPERSRRLFSAFDPVIQRVINEEDGGVHRRYASPSLRDRNVQSSRTPSQTHTTTLPGYGTSAIVAMDKSSTLSSGTSLSSGLILSEAKSLGKGTERTLESVLHSSKQKVSAIESMLKGLDMSGRHNNSTFQSTSLDLGVDPPSARDPPFPSAVPSSTYLTNSANSTASNMSKALSLTYSTKKTSERQRGGSPVEENSDMTRMGRRYMNTQIDRQYQDTPYKDAYFRDSQNSYIPNFQRPLLRKPVAGRVSASSRNSFDDSQLTHGEMPRYMDGPSSLNDALTEGLSSSSDWSARVSAFNYIRTLQQQGPRGIQEITQSFEKVMKLFFKHLDDPHHKVAQAALSTLAEMIPTCRKPFESYVERILPHVFSRLIDQKELVRQPCSATLEIVSKTYGIDSLLPALLRSLDEQRSPKAKLAVIEFAINSFNKHSMNSESSGNSGILKLWLAKLAPLAHDKNTKLKEAAITCIISVYSNYDSSSVLYFIISLSVEEQNSLRRALKQYTPRIEVELMNYLQNRRERQRTKSFFDQSDVVGTSSEEGYPSASKKGQNYGRYSAGSVDSDGGRKWSSMQESTLMRSSIDQEGSEEMPGYPYQNLETSSNREVVTSKSNDMMLGTNNIVENNGLWTTHLKNSDRSMDLDNSLSTPRLDGMAGSGHRGSRFDRSLDLDNSLSTPRQDGMEGSGHRGSKFDKESSEVEFNHEKPIFAKISSPESVPSIPQILHQICNGGDQNASVSKSDALRQLVDVSMVNDHQIWSKYFNQILTVVLEVLDDPDSSIRELALSLIVEMLNHQKDSMDDSVEIVLEKLLHVTKDTVAKVSSEAEQCLTIVLSQYDPYRCLTVIVPLLVSEDEKTLVTCINCLTKLVGRLSQEELMTQLPSFLPALFDAFGNQSADVRKTVVFCLVDIYIMLGKSFLPHLEGLNSTQLRLVTIYANRISQARSGTAIDGNHG